MHGVTPSLLWVDAERPGARGEHPQEHGGVRPRGEHARDPAGRPRGRHRGLPAPAAHRLQTGRPGTRSATPGLLLIWGCWRRVLYGKELQGWLLGEVG